MKKILNILTLREPAGAQQAEFLFRGYSKRVFNIKTVYLYDKVKNDDMESISLFDRRPKFFEMPTVFLRLVFLILRYKPDVVMCWGRTSNPFGVLASLFHRCKRVAMQSSASNNYKLSKGRLKIIGFITIILDHIIGYVGLYNLNIIVSDYNFSTYAGYTKRYLKHCKVINNGVVLDTSNVSPNDPQFLHLKNKKTIGSIGRLVNLKNQAVVIQALPYIPDVHYVVVGQGPDKAYLLSEAKKYSVEDRFSIIDVIDHKDINSFLSNLSIFMFPSLTESFGLAAIEAAAMSLPIVAVDVPWAISILGADFPTIVENNSKSIAQITNKILNDTKFYEELKERSAKLASKFSFDTMAKSYISELENLTK